MFAAPVYWCYLVSSTNKLMQYTENQNVSSTRPIRLRCTGVLQSSFVCTVQWHFFRLSTGVLQLVPPYPQKFAFSGTIPFGSYPNMQNRIKIIANVCYPFYERPFSKILHIAVELKLINMIVLRFERQSRYCTPVSTRNAINVHQCRYRYSRFEFTYCKLINLFPWDCPFKPQKVLFRFQFCALT
jgi:hypothetical protein